MAGGERTVNKKALIMLQLALVAVVGQRRVGEWLWESGLSFQGYACPPYSML